jgi:hypothetical protein
MDLHVGGPVAMNSRDNDRIYRSFEEFERDELRRMETLGASVDDMIDAIFGEESVRNARSRWDEDDDE